MENNTDDGYFSSYAYPGIHEEMIKDTERTKSYYRAIRDNSHIFKDKIVLDVGCGTGILSLFASDAGAKHVYAVDNSCVIDVTRSIIEINGYSDKITLIKSKIEDTVLPVDHVDIIISEWMGYCLLFESMLDSVIFARDKWLVDGGWLFPDIASLYICGIEDHDYRDDKIDWWDNVYGYKMTPMKDRALKEPLIDYVNQDIVITNDALIRRFDLYKVSSEDVASFTSQFTLRPLNQDFMHALVIYFTVEFSMCHKRIVIYTGPNGKPTHWKQTILYLQNPYRAYQNQDISFVIGIGKNKTNKRHLDIKLDLLDTDCPGGFIEQNRYTLA